MDTKRGVVEIRNPKAPAESPKQFTFDAIYDWNSKQSDLYDETFRSLVDAVLDGFNGTIFAYGQTGTGKTFTMEGRLLLIFCYENRGILCKVPLFSQAFEPIRRNEG